MESMYFIFDGIKSSDMNLYIMRIEHSGFIETPFISGLDIKEERHSKRYKPYFFGVERECIEFTVQFVLADEYMRPKEWTPQDRYRISKWLIHNEYKEFQTSDDLGKVYNALAISDTNLNLLNTQGYIEITFRTNSPYAYTPTYVDNFDLSTNTTTQTITLENKSNIIDKYRPKIEIQSKGSSTITLKNLSFGGKELKLTGLYNDEIISIDGENELILSNHALHKNPLDLFNKNMNYRYWGDLVFGQNQILVEGKCLMWVKYCFPIIQ